MKNSIYLIISNNLERVFSLIIFGIIVDKMSIDDFGMFKWILSIAMFAIFILNLGLDSTVVREIKGTLNEGDTNNVNEYLRDYFVFKSTLFIFLGVAVLIFSDYLLLIFDLNAVIVYSILLMTLFGVYFRSLLETLTNINLKSYVIKNIDVCIVGLLTIYLLLIDNISLNHLLFLYISKELILVVFLIYYNNSSLNNNGIGYKISTNKKVDFNLFKTVSFKQLWIGNAFKDISFKFLDSGLDILLIGIFLTKKDVALYSFSATIALILMNLNLFKMTRSFMNVFMLDITDEGKDFDKVNRIVYVYGLVNQIAVYLLYIPFLVIVYYVISNYYQEYILCYPMIVFLSFGYSIYSNYYTLSGLVFIYKNPSLFTRAGFIVGLINFLFNLLALCFFDVYVLSISTMLGLIVTPFVLINLINKEYKHIVIAHRYLLFPVLIYVPLFIVYFFHRDLDIWLIATYVVITHFFYLKHIINSLILFRDTCLELFVNLKKY